uniref:Uncharacterized protein n=1 Tax=Anguilla anguilla TaxID=7936 RepID=A0A0E9V0L5_ANGAN
MLWDWRLGNFPVAWHYHGYSQIKNLTVIAIPLVSRAFH